MVHGQPKVHPGFNFKDIMIGYQEKFKMLSSLVNRGVSDVPSSLTFHPKKFNKFREYPVQLSAPLLSVDHVGFRSAGALDWANGI